MKRDYLNSLIERCANRDEDAWAEFVARFRTLIKWAITERLRRFKCFYNDEDLEDIRQQVFSDLWKRGRLVELKDIKSVEAWLAVVAGNYAISYMRSRRRLSYVCLEDILEKKAEPHGTYSHLEAGEMNDVVASFISKLPSRHQAVLTLSYFYGKRHKEIAEITKIPVNTVSTIIKRTRVLLKEELQSRGYENF